MLYVVMGTYRNIDNEIRHYDYTVVAGSKSEAVEKASAYFTPQIRKTLIATEAIGYREYYNLR